MPKKDAPLPWPEANRRYLMAAVELVEARVGTHLKMVDPDKVALAQKKLAAAHAALPESSTLENLGAWLGLSAFERDVVVLLAAGELDGSFVQRLAQLPGGARITFSLALAALPGAHWSALSPQSPLRSWRLLFLEGEGLVHAPLRIDERILHFLTSTPAMERSLADALEPVAAPETLPASLAEAAEAGAAAWADTTDGWPILQLCGAEISAQHAIAATAAAKLGFGLHAVDARDIPLVPAERHLWFRLWQREAILSHSALLIENMEIAPPEILRSTQQAPGPIFLAVREPVAVAPRGTVRIAVPMPDREEQRAAWRAALGNAACEHEDAIDAVIAQFVLPPAAIATAGRQVRGGLVRACPSEPDQSVDPDEPPPPSPLWQSCRVQVSTRLGELAQRIEPQAQWSHLVLPEAQKQTLRTLVAHVRQRSQVYDDWGFGAGNARGLGLSTLFSGPSGTGKTMAAEVLARQLSLDLYRIDLSAVVSKYIGETEKNLRRVFDAAESGGAVLLFDEADALFGRRSEVKDSHDRYANIEVSYLLQRMESYRGLAILTTNLKEALDSAFVRRLRFMVQFPFPDPVQRAEIWRCTIPRRVPTRGLDFRKLARLNVTGGSIRNIALNAAFLAADAGEDLQMHHLRIAAEAEAAKLERPLLESEVSGWN